MRRVSASSASFASAAANPGLPGLCSRFPSNGSSRRAAFQGAPGERMVLRSSAEPGRQSCSSGQPDCCCSVRWRFPTPGPQKPPPPPPAIPRTVVAAAKLPTVTDVPLYFKAVSITLQPDEKSGVSAANGILYQMSGSTEVAGDGEAKILNAREEPVSAA